VGLDAVGHDGAGGQDGGELAVVDDQVDQGNHGRVQLGPFPEDGMCRGCLTEKLAAFELRMALEDARESLHGVKLGFGEVDERAVKGISSFNAA
jgi:hypothetical protein